MGAASNSGNASARTAVIAKTAPTVTRPENSFMSVQCASYVHINLHLVMKSRMPVVNLDLGTEKFF